MVMSGVPPPMVDIHSSASGVFHTKETFSVRMCPTIALQPTVNLRQVAVSVRRL